MSKYGHTIEVDGDVESTKQFVSTVIGMAPLIVASSLMVANLFAENSDKLDGEHGSYYLDAANLTNKYTTLSGWGITDAWTKAEADARYRGVSWVPTLDQVLTAGDTSDKSINLQGYGDRTFSFYDMNVYNGGHLGIIDGYPELKLGDATFRHENGAIEVSGRHLRTTNGDPYNENDLTRKAYVDAKTSLLSSAGANTWLGNNTGSGAAPAYNSLSALTRTNDTNITLTLGGTPATALAKSVSMTLGWTGQLAISRGGTGLSSVGTSGQLLRSNGTGLEYFTHDFISSTLIGAANGIASLDASGKVPLAQLPVTGMQYMGEWNATTNSPSLSNGSGTNGHWYRVTTAGTVNFGAGNITFIVGDAVIYNGSVWQKDPAGAASTNLALGTITGTTIPITNSNGSGFTLPSATTTLAGLLSAADKVKINAALISETDPTVPAHVKAILSGDITNWNTAYSMRHDSVTLSGQNYLSLSGQAITANAINLTSHVTGVLPRASGGTGISSTGSANQLLRVNAGGTALEYFTPSYLTENQTITLTGDITGSGATSIAATIANSAVTDAKLRNSAALSVIGRSANSTGAVADIAAGTDGYVLRRAGTTLGFGTIGDASISGLDWGKLTGLPSTYAPSPHTLDSHSNVTITSPTVGQYIGWSGTAWVNQTLPEGVVYLGSTSIILSGNSFQRAALTGDVTAAQNNNNLTIANGAVTFAKMQSISDGRLLGRVTTGSGAIEALTAAQIRTMLNVADGANNYTHPNSGVTAGTYNNVTVNAQGHVTAGSNQTYIQNLSWTPSTGALSISGGTGTNLDGRYWRQQIGASTDMDAEYRQGQGYYTPGSAGEKPSGSSYGTFINWSAYGGDTTGTSQWNHQLMMPSHVPDVHIRLGNSASWSTLYRLWSDRHFTSSDVANWNAAYAAMGNYVTVNTSQSGITGKKEWLGDHTWTPAGTNTSTNNSVMLGATVDGPYLNLRNASAQTVTLRSFEGANHIQLLLTVGTVSLHANAYSSGGYGYLVRNSASGALETRTIGIGDITGLQTAIDGKYATPIGTTAQYVRGDGSLATFPALTGGTVTSVNIAPPTGFTAGSAVTTSGNITLSYAAGYALPTTAKQTAWDTSAARWFSINAPTGNDLNNATQGGVLYWSNTTANAPASTYGTVFTFVGASSTGDGAASNTWINQILASTGNDWYIRQSINNWSTWSATYKIWTEKHFSSTNVSQWNTAYGWGTHTGLYVPLARTISAGTGLSGGGALSSNQTLSFNTIWGDARYSQVGHSHATLNPGTGISGNGYNGSSTQTWSISFGTSAGQAAEGNDSRINNGQMAYGWGDWRNRSINTTGSIQGGGNFYSDRTFSLVGDNGSPGNGKYYGTNGSGSKGFWDLPSISGYVPTDRIVSGAVSIQGGGDMTTNRYLQLVGDTTTPGANRYYGTNGSETKGWWALPSAGVGGSGTNGYVPLWNSGSSLTISVMVQSGGTIHINGPLNVASANAYIGNDLTVYGKAEVANGVFAGAHSTSSMNSLSANDGTICYNTTISELCVKRGGTWYRLTRGSAV